MDSFVPYDAKLEKEIIGSMLVDPPCVGDVIETIEPNHFYLSDHRKLCKEIFRLWQKDEDLVNLIEMIPFLEKEKISVSEVTEMANTVASSRLVRYHAERLKEIAALRSAIELGREMAAAGYLRDSQEIREMLNRFETRLSGITQTTTKTSTLTSIQEAIVRFNDEFDQIYQKGGGITGTPTGFNQLDIMTAGYQKQDLIILAGRPSMGKTAFALETALQIGKRTDEPALIFELEMGESSLVKRMVANIGMIDIHSLTMGTISKSDFERYTNSLAELYERKLILDTQPAITIAEMKAKARRIKREQGLSCIIVDYLGLIPGERGMSRYETVSENARQLKAMARELNVPVIALCQLSRAVEQRNDKRPMLSDLRESGEIEQTADLVMFLYRDDYYNSDSPKKDIAEVIIAKHRNGPTGKVELLFKKEFGKFLELPRGYGQ